MKKLVLALTAAAAFTGSASAADLAARPYTKAPAPVAPAYNWTGFYIFGGGGGGLWNADSNVQLFPGGTAFTRDQRLGGSGWFGTVGAGYDWQFNSRWVAGIFDDGQFGSLKGTIRDRGRFLGGNIRNESSWVGGARIGYVIARGVRTDVQGVF